MRRWAVLLVVMAIVVGPGVAPAHGQEPGEATVTRVTSGETLVVETADGLTVAARLIGIEAPAPRDCGGAEARDALRDLVAGEPARLVSDPAYGATDDRGRSWLYVDRADDGRDAGQALVRAGWATVVERPPFARWPAYREAERDAAGGVWRLCDGDFALTPAEQRRALLRDARRFVRDYYRRLSRDRYRQAWRMLGAPVRRRLGHRYRGWRASYRRSLGVGARPGRARLAGGRPLVPVRLRSRDRDACNSRVVVQRFRGTVRLAQRGDSFVVVRFRIRKTAGKRPRLSKSECPKPEPPPDTGSGGGGGGDGGGGTNCQGYDPCLSPGSDVDCLGGSGDGPRYTGPVRVYGSDPYGLDSDGDGYGCES